jgi:hypothetical protein
MEWKQKESTLRAHLSDHLEFLFQQTFSIEYTKSDILVEINHFAEQNMESSPCHVSCFDILEGLKRLGLLQNRPWKFFRNCFESIEKNMKEQRHLQFLLIDETTFAISQVEPTNQVHFFMTDMAAFARFLMGKCKPLLDANEFFFDAVWKPMADLIVKIDIDPRIPKTLNDIESFQGMIWKEVEVFEREMVAIGIDVTQSPIRDRISASFQILEQSKSEYYLSKTRDLLFYDKHNHTLARPIAPNGAFPLPECQIHESVEQLHRMIDSILEEMECNTTV